jgi:hypothetical protein
MFRKLLLIALCILSTNLLARGTYQEPEAFLAGVFTDSVPEPAVIWLTGERQKIIEAILGHRYSSLRVRYWQTGTRSAWILDEIGKEQPITAGIVVNESMLERIDVLAFRESRGWEIRYPFFTDQFRESRLDKEYQLDHQIDGISGATLSVRAMKKLAALALYLDAETRNRDVTPAP